MSLTIALTILSIVTTVAMMVGVPAPKRLRSGEVYGTLKSMLTAAKNKSTAKYEQVLEYLNKTPIPSQYRGIIKKIVSDSRRDLSSKVAEAKKEMTETENEATALESDISSHQYATNEYKDSKAGKKAYNRLVDRVESLADKNGVNTSATPTKFSNTNPLGKQMLDKVENKISDINSSIKGGITI